MKNGIAFSSGGWRGKVGDDFTEENVARVARAFVLCLFQQRPSHEIFKVAIGFDGRADSRGVCISYCEDFVGKWNLRPVKLWNCADPCAFVRHLAQWLYVGNYGDWG